MSQKECEICSENYENEHKLECGHIFHKECIETWLIISNSCPLCRYATEPTKQEKNDDESIPEISYEPVNISNISPQFGQKVNITIPRFGDIISALMDNPIKIKLPPIKNNIDWTNKVGKQPIHSVNFEVGGQTIDKYHGEWLDIWEKLTSKPVITGTSCPTGPPGATGATGFTNGMRATGATGTSCPPTGAPGAIGATGATNGMRKSRYHKNLSYNH